MTDAPAQTISQAPGAAHPARPWSKRFQLAALSAALDRHPFRIFAALFVWFLLTALIRYHRLIPAWFTADEVDILAHVDGRGLIDIFTGYDVSANNFVPLLLVSLKLDWAIFEWWIPGYRLHSIVSASIAAMMIVALLRRWCAWPTAVLAGFVFLLSVDTAALIGYTASRHYLEGLIPAIGAIILTLRYLDRGGPTPLLGAIACYFAATLFKEIYAPLPALLLVLPGVRLPRRALLLGAFALPAAAYFVYRRAMMGQFVGGYGGGQYDPFEIARYLVSAWPQFTGWMIYGTARWAWWLPIPINALLLWTLCRAARSSGLLAASYLMCLAVAIGPVSLVLGTPQVNFIEAASHYCQRFTFPAFVVILLWGAWALERLDRRVALIALTLLLMVGLNNTSRQIRSWIHDGRTTQASARAFESWWDRKAVYAADVPRQLHLGLIKIWSRRAEAPPTHTARVIPAWPGAISSEDPILQEADIVFVESLYDGVRQLGREEFLAKYASP